MDNHFNDTIVHSPSAFIAAWRRVHNIFVSEGATNAVWVWCPTTWAYQTGEAANFYPGGAYVDWLCADGFNWYPGKTGSYWRSFESVFTPFYNWGAPTGKPLMVGETGAMEWTAGKKAAWISNAATAVKSSFPAMKAFVYFDTEKGYDWRANSSTSAYAAFKKIATDPYFVH